MNRLQLLALVMCCGPLLVSCESTDLASHHRPAGNQEAKRIAAAEQEQQQTAEVDEAQRNLWNAQHDVLTRDGNPNLRFY
ncbi:MAG: hypothetical protein QOG48_421 [Verrucomicrobiota bacterium]|jgi:hypothetical protein